MQKTIWAEPRKVISIDDCDFYHTMDIPNYGTVRGDWDLRGKETAYLGNTSFDGKRVLEIGTASGHLCFTMEKMGANVVAYDLSDEQDWDIVPYASYDYEQHISARKAHIRRLNNGFWFAHSANKSQARVVYGSVYTTPENIGQFDICTFGSILLHLRDPFLALQRVTAHVRETVIVTDIASGFMGRMLTMAESLSGIRLIAFVPNARKLKPFETWWRLSPGLVCEFLQILGFAHTTISFHRQLYQNKELQLFTVVGQRKITGTH
ncbi:MAG: methyltransferase domain-containing protein [Chloroflexi bacterium]|nr:MAG: methyltransferase domain-containing protein [Chloroflexota bacterium]